MNYSVKTLKSVLLIFCLFIYAINYSQDSKKNLQSGILQFETLEINYGTLQQHDNGERIFKFTNTGMIPIVITKVKTTCGCTIPKYPKKAILPGDKGEIKIKYATNRIGKFSKAITVFSNAKNAIQVLKIKGEVFKNTI